MSKKGHQKGLLKTKTIPSEQKDPFLLCYPHSSQVQRAYQGRKDPGFVGERVKGSPGVSYRTQKWLKNQPQEKIILLFLLLNEKEKKNSLQSARHPYTAFPASSSTSTNFQSLFLPDGPFFWNTDSVD